MYFNRNHHNVEPEYIPSRVSIQQISKPGLSIDSHEPRNVCRNQSLIVRTQDSNRATPRYANSGAGHARSSLVKERIKGHMISEKGNIHIAALSH